MNISAVSLENQCLLIHFKYYPDRIAIHDEITSPYFILLADANFCGIPTTK